MLRPHRLLLATATLSVSGKPIRTIGTRRASAVQAGVLPLGKVPIWNTTAPTSAARNSARTGCSSSSLVMTTVGPTTVKRCSRTVLVAASTCSATVTSNHGRPTEMRPMLGVFKGSAGTAAAWVLAPGNHTSGGSTRSAQLNLEPPLPLPASRQKAVLAVHLHGLRQ